MVNYSCELNDERKVRCPMGWRYVIAFLLSIGMFIFSSIEDQLEIPLLPHFSNRNTTLNLASITVGVHANQKTRFVSMILGGAIVLTCNSKMMLAYAIGGMSVTNMLIPLFQPIGGVFIIFICVFKGFFEGMVIPFLITILSYWAPISENSTLVAIALCGYFLGQNMNIIDFSYFGLKHFGSPFYLFGGLGLLWAAILAITVKEKPTEDKKISANELLHIAGVRSNGEIRTLTSYHRKQMFRRSIMSIVTVNTSLVFNICVISSIQLKFLLVPNIAIFKVEYASFFMNLITAIVVILVALASDHFKNYISLTKIRKFFICTGLICSAVLLPFISIYYPHNTVTHFALFGLYATLQGIVLQGSFANSLDVVNHAAGYVVGISFGLAWLLAALIHCIIKLIYDSHHKSDFEEYFLPSSWLPMLVITKALNVLAFVIYLLYGSAKEEIWASENSGTTNLISNCDVDGTNELLPSLHEL